MCKYCTLYAILCISNYRLIKIIDNYENKILNNCDNKFFNEYLQKYKC